MGEFTDGVTSGVHSAFIYTDPKHGRHAYITNDGTGAVHDQHRRSHEAAEVAQWEDPARGTATSGARRPDVDVQDGLLYGSWWNDGLIIPGCRQRDQGGTPSKPMLVSQFKNDLDALYKTRVETEAGAGSSAGRATAWRHRTRSLLLTRC
ncbi:MAG: hypothetical protein IPK85_00070 [Gemmatimonadetes bacterium]|nr:hypothetical protein [Gemmatimonadota bacterium]